MKLRDWMFGAAVAGALWGCGSGVTREPVGMSYFGPTAGVEEVAVIRPRKGGFMDPHVMVVEVDGEEVRPVGELREVKVTPGVHRLAVMNTMRFESVFSFRFEKGNVYRTERRGPFDQRVKMVNETTGQEFVPELPSQPGLMTNKRRNHVLEGL